MTESSRDDRINKVIADFLKAVEQGDAPDQKAILARHPDLAEELRAFFHDQEQLQHFAAGLSPAPPATPELTVALAGRPQPQGETIAPTEPVVDTVKPLGTVRYFGDYELLEEIARGGMGVVYRVRQVSLNREVALKMILAGQLASADELKRFQREAEAAAKLDHSNIVPIYEIGEHQGQHYFSMKLIDGTNLGRRAADFVRDSKGAVKLLVKVARAVHYAHQRGILHRDLKPSNILLDAAAEPFVADFGLAKHVDGSGLQTRSGAIVGTPSYMAPEQARAERTLTAAVDVYGLGAILYELLTGRPPFRATNELDTILQVVESEPASLRTLNSRIPADLEASCLKCLDKKPENRYVSALALAEDLERWLAGQPILARPSGPGKKVLKWTKRNPTQTALLVVLACWYLNIRLPWEWAWLGWAFYGYVMLVGFWSLIVVCGRVLGKWPGMKVELVDVILVPSTALAWTVLAFYPGDFADRKTLTYTIVLFFLCWGYVVQWLRRRKQAGLLQAALRTPIGVTVLVGVLCGIGFIQGLSELLELIQPSKPEGDLLVKFCVHLQSLSGSIYLFLMLSVGYEFRELGCVTFFRYLPWEEIESFSWRTSTSKDFLAFRLKLRNSPVFIQKAVHAANKEKIDPIIIQHLPQAEPEAGASGASQVFEWHGVEPADRVRAPGGTLVLSGICQIAGCLCCGGGLSLALINQPDFEKRWEMSQSTAVLVIILTAVSTLVGPLCIAGGLKMRKLKNYRFCRMICILAMLPLGYGVVAGLPAGIWGLLVLRRADVQAAFAELNAATRTHSTPGRPDQA
jgi:predicted Ser/Thr protein kinase